MPSSRGPSRPRDQTQVSCTAGGFFTASITWEAVPTWTPYYNKSLCDMLLFTVGIDSL